MTPPPNEPPNGHAPLSVDLRRYPGFRRLAADYAFAFENLREFYAGNPAEPGAWEAAIERAQAQPRQREALAEILASQQQRRAAGPEAQAAARALRDPATVAVVTGQQAGVFGGPMFTLLKAITALKLAARIRQDHGVPAVAVFWIDAEDHDWNEVSGCEILDADLQPQTVRLPTPIGAGERPVAAFRLDASAIAAIDELAALLPPTEFTATLLTRLRSAYRPNTGMAEAFGRWLEFVLGDFGLIVYDAADAATKPLVQEIFTREIQFAGRSSELAADAGARLQARGYHAQVTPQPDHLALFFLDGGRTPIVLSDGRFTAGGRTFDLPTLTSLSISHPAAFSPNVLLRPIVQDRLFPTVAYVAGPNELAYLGQLKPVYAHFGVPMPLMYGRASATLLDSAAIRFLSKYGLPLESLHTHDESMLNRLLETRLPPAVEAAYQDTATAIEERMQRLIDAVPAIDPTLEGAARSATGRMRHELQGLHTKIIHAAKKRDETLRRQFTRTQAQAFPGGHAQERSTGFVYFLNRYGPALVDRLLIELPLEPGFHWIINV